MSCDFPKCRDEGYIIYLTKDICHKHWSELANAEDESENKILQKIKLVRNPEKEVVRLK